MDSIPSVFFIFLKIFYFIILIILNFILLYLNLRDF